ncbi:hypothetical protein OF83DRAFT_1085029 [Amylostereum chailletii]|nr:hypothetical protein OF83DRAFT_1085029 [Amylostereum chailletii]
MLAHATHDDLQATCPTYVKLYDSSRLDARIAEGRLTKLRKAYSDLLRKVSPPRPAARLALYDAAPWNRFYRVSDFPGVKFCDQQIWKDHDATMQDTNSAKGAGKQGGTRKAEGENVSTGFFEDEYGNPLDGQRAGKARETARNIYASWETRGISPDKWSQIPIDLLNQFLQHMYDHSPHLRLCDQHWKAREFGSQTFRHSKTKSPATSTAPAARNSGAASTSNHIKTAPVEATVPFS